MQRIWSPLQSVCPQDFDPNSLWEGIAGASASIGLGEWLTFVLEHLTCCATTAALTSDVDTEDVILTVKNGDFVTACEAPEVLPNGVVRQKVVSMAHGASQEGFVTVRGVSGMPLFIAG